MNHYILDDKNNVVPASLMEWAVFFENSPRRIVARNTAGPDVDVSTVFLGVDHNFGGGRPLLFETMVFRNGNGEEMDRYSTWEEAEAGHKAMLKMVMEETASDDA